MGPGLSAKRLNRAWARAAGRRRARSASARGGGTSVASSSALNTTLYLSQPGLISAAMIAASRARPRPALPTLALWASRLPVELELASFVKLNSPTTLPRRRSFASLAPAASNSTACLRTRELGLAVHGGGAGPRRVADLLKPGLQQPSRPSS